MSAECKFIAPDDFLEGTGISKRTPTELFLMFRKDESGSFDSGITWQCFPDTVDPRGPKGK